MLAKEFLLTIYGENPKLQIMAAKEEQLNMHHCSTTQKIDMLFNAQ